MARTFDYSPYSHSYGGIGGNWMRYGNLDSALSNLYSMPAGSNFESEGGSVELTSDLLKSLGLSDEDVNMLLNEATKTSAPRNDSVINSLAQELSQGDYSEAAKLGGVSEAQLERQIAGDLQRYGVTSLSQLGVRQTALGDTVYYNKETGQALPEQFGTDYSGEDGRSFSLTALPDGSVVPVSHYRGSSDWQTVRDAIRVWGSAYLGGVAAEANGLQGAGAGTSEWVGGSQGLGGAAFNNSIGPTTENAFAPTGSGLAGGETTLGSGTYGLDSLGNTLQLSEGAAAAGGFTPSTVGGPLDLGTPINGTGTAGLGLTQVTNDMPNITPDGQPTTTAPTPDDPIDIQPNPTTGRNGELEEIDNGGGLANGDILGLLASLFGANDTGWIDDLRDIAGQTLERADPFGPQRPYYQDRLRETYDNPQAVYDRDYSALDNVFFNELRAQDAARGRSTDSYKRGVEREAKFQDWMLDNRTQLGGFAGANIDPSNAAGNYLGAMTNLGMLERNQQMAPWQAIGNFLGGNDGLSLNDIGDAAGTVYDWGSRLVDFFGGS